ncbi:MAG: ABC transporter substrate-binding protein [Chloroflexota bacterium]
MKRVLARVLIAAVLVTIVFAAAGCGKKAPETLKVGIMPAVNSLPLIIAKHNGYFEAEGLSVELLQFQSQTDRESALQAGQIDGTVTDLINAVTEVANGFPVKVASGTDGRFALLASAKSGFQSLADLRGKTGLSTGLIANSVVVFETERFLTKAGLPLDTYELTSIPQIPARLEALAAGQTQLALLPEPLATMAEIQGAKLLADTEGEASTAGALVFTDAAIRDKAKALKAFYRAYDKAVAELNANWANYKDVIVTEGQFPPPVKDALKPQTFRAHYLPTREEVGEIIDWMIGKGSLKPGQVTYEQLVTEAFSR